MDALELRVEPAPARHAVDVLRRLELRGSALNCSQSSSTSLLDLAEDAERPRREVGRRARSRRAGPATSRSGTGRAAGAPGRSPRPATFCSALDRNTRAYTSGVAVVDQGVLPAPRVRAGAAAPRRRTSCSGWSRTTCSPAGVCEALLLTPKARVIAPLARLAPRRGRLPAPHRARARRDGARAPDADAVRRASARSSPRSTPRRSSSASADGDPEPRLRRARGRGARRGRRGRAARRGARAAADPGAHAALGRRDRRPRPAGRGRASTSARSRSRRAAIRARSRSRGCTTAATRTGRCACSRSTAAGAAATRSATAGKAVGRVTSAVPGLALAYVRVEVSGRRRARGRPASRARLH